MKTGWNKNLSLAEMFMARCDSYCDMKKPVFAREQKSRLPDSPWS